MYHKIINKLCENKFEAFIVGGAVRDLLLGEEPKDYDIVTNAKIDQICLLFENEKIDLVGANFQVAMINGEWTFDEVIQFASNKEKQLEEIYLKSDLPYSPKENMPKIKEILLNSLEMWYEDTKELIVNKNDFTKLILTDLQTIINKYNVPQ